MDEARVCVDSASAEATVAIGERLGRALEAGDVLGLTGSLGAGKTQITHGLVAGILAERGGSIADVRVCSPSYTIVNSYASGDALVHHMDLYRLSSFDDLESTGYWDLIAEDGMIALVEWIGQIPDAAPDDGWVELVLSFVDPERPDRSPRRLTLENHGDPEAFARLAAALSA